MKALFLPRQTVRSTLRRAFLIILAALVITAALTTRPARARTPSTVVTTTILPVPGVKSTFDNIDIFAKTDRNPDSRPPDWWLAQLRTKGASDHFVVRNAFAGGATTGWHNAPWSKHGHGYAGQHYRIRRGGSDLHSARFYRR